MPDLLWWCERITWIDPDGDAYVLTSADDHDVLEGITGRGMPPIRTNVQTIPQQAGTRTRSKVHDARQVAFPVVFYDENLAAVREILRGRMRTFDPTRGDSTIRVRTVEGVERELTAHYIGGMEITEAPDERGVTYDQAHQAGVLVVHADDPYWYDVEPLTEEFTVSTPSGGFFPIPNPTTGSFITLVASEVFTTATVTLTADVPSWPVWTITGPGASPALRNLDTGELLDLSDNGGLVLAAGETATIDTRPYHKTILKNDGTNLYPYLTDAGSDFWPLQPGDNTIQVEMTDATEETIVALSVAQAYLTV